MTTPHYGIWPFDLGVARTDKLRVTAGIIVFVDALNAAGEFQPGALIEISLSDRDQDFVPFYPGSKLLNKTSDQVRLKWAAQPGITAKLLIGEPDILDLEIASRATVLVGALGDTLTVAAKAPTTAELELAAANANRKRLTLKNVGGVTVYIGATGVATASGYPVDPGGEYETSFANAAFFGITASGTGAIRVLEETS